MSIDSVVMVTEPADRVQRPSVIDRALISWRPSRESASASRPNKVDGDRVVHADAGYQSRHAGALVQERIGRS